MRQVHFSRNPKIAAFLQEYDYVQEFGEGVDRMYKEMERAGMPAPEYRDVAFMLNATIRNGISVVDNFVENVADNVVDRVANAMSAKKLSATELGGLNTFRFRQNYPQKNLPSSFIKGPELSNVISIP